MTTPTRRPAAALAALAAAALVATACFEDPVEEEIRLAFAADGGVEVTLTQRLSLLHLDSDNPRLAHRLRQERRRLAEGWDGWPLRFERARPSLDEVAFRRFGGQLVEVERDASLDDPGAVGRLFSDLMTAAYTFDPESGAGELVFYPTTASRATGGERQRVERRLDDWSAAVADYVAAVDRLYRHLEANPERARPLFARLFASDEDDEAALGEREAELVGDAGAGIEAVAAVLLVPEDDAWTWNELARRVYDPFPARVVVRTPAAPRAAEGFVERDGEWAVPALDLWGAFTALEGRWISPDPAATWVAAARDFEDVDLDAWLARPRRRGETPTPAEVRTAFEAALQPAGVYRLAWRARNGPA